VIERYTLPEMGKVWAAQSRFEYLLVVEKAVASVQGELKIIPQDAADAIVKKGTFDYKRILEIERTTKHDVIAFVTDVGNQVGELGQKYVHFGLTSSDVLDSAFSLQIQEAEKILIQKIKKLDQALVTQIKKHKDTLCAGRTHGMHAEPTTFGLKLSGFLCELRRNAARVSQACADASRLKLSGAVGTFSALGEEVEKHVAIKLNLKQEIVATQVIPRDRHASVMGALALLMAGFERLALEIRHLQRTEVSEVEESFSVGQKGSSAMPHKKNPITSENICGLARLLRGYHVAALEDIALWHERDISHSSVERVIFPDAFILCDYAAEKLSETVTNLFVNVERMKFNLDISKGKLFSSHVLLELIRNGLPRDQAYKLVQRVSQDGSLKNLKESLLNDSETKKYLKPDDLEKIFSGVNHLKSISLIIERALNS
jgi:adenylosuccinate lyase